MQRLILTVPDRLDPQVLGATLEGGAAAAVVFEGRSASPALIEVAQNAGAAALATCALGEGASPWPLKGDADGAHLVGDFAARVAGLGRRPEGLTVGAAAQSRHEAMTLGEAGSDYVWFGSTATLSEAAAEMACWWQALFEVPAVVAGPSDQASLEAMIVSRAEFVAMVDVFGDDRNEAALVARANLALDGAEGAI